MSMGIFTITKDFEYLTVHPNAVEVFNKIISNFKQTNHGDFSNNNFTGKSDLGYCCVSFDQG